jgi:hypothetical protein
LALGAKDREGLGREQVCGRPLAVSFQQSLTDMYEKYEMSDDDLADESFNTALMYYAGKMSCTGFKRRTHWHMK